MLRVAGAVVIVEKARGETGFGRVSPVLYVHVLHYCIAYRRTGSLVSSRQQPIVDLVPCASHLLAIPNEALWEPPYFTIYPDILEL